jgi:microsomal dipeptidase-like Zn-dependent dipeptidase
MIIREARRQGVERIVVTHAMQAPVRMNVAQMQEAARMGAFIEFVYGSLLGANKLDLADFVRAIREVGPASCILSSDLGQPGNPLHPDGLATFFAALRKEGFSDAEIALMSKTNPARVLGLQ